MNLQLGKRYVLNSGKEMEVVYEGEGAEFPVIGKIFFETRTGLETWEPSAWTLGGRNWKNKKSDVKDQITPKELTPTELLFAAAKAREEGDLTKADELLETYHEARPMTVSKVEPHVIMKPRPEPEW